MDGSLLQNMILALIVVTMLMRTVEGAQTLSSGGSLRGDDTIVSQNGRFELGFFNPNGTNNWYLGIWYANVSQKAYVWVANRESPLKKMPAILNLSRDGELGLFDAEGASLWSANGSKAASEAVLMDSGNFVMLGAENRSETLWESFDHPVDTWLPGMKFGGKMKLICWRDTADPAPGIFSFQVNQSGTAKFVLHWNDSVQYWQSGVWDGKFPYTTQQMRALRNAYSISTEKTPSGVYFTYTVPLSMNTRFVMGRAGAVMLYMLTDNRWDMFMSYPRDQCKVYGLCGAYGTCNSSNMQFCSCQEGFRPRDEQAWDSQKWWSSGCVRTSSSSKKRRSKLAPVVGGVAACAIVLAILACLLWRIRSKQGCPDKFAAYFTVATRPEAEVVDAATSIRMFSYRELQISTRRFTQKLGSGAFGSVYRGTLPDGALVAVKKLHGTGPGEKQFRAEINTVGNINHVNLIRLRGFCAEKSKRLLVYDYMPNGSLNTFLFNKSKNERKVEDWKARFQIALGVARGLAYLHEECVERIIHCDVKPENILLDGNFCPKLGDFGLAKLVGRDFSRVLTTTRGTRGYLAPEWISGLPITPKADVYSFGMTLLEIISGRRNLDLGVQESSKIYFPTWAATQIHKADLMSVVDSRVVNSADEEEVRRAGVVSMLCIQDDETLRPSMGQVLLMLEGKTKLHTPPIPKYLFTRMDQDSDSSF